LTFVIPVALRGGGLGWARQGGPHPVAVLRGHTERVDDLEFGPEGRTLATVDADGSARLWDITDRAKPRVVARLAGHIGALNAVAFSPDGKLLATAGQDYTVRLWRL
jgi:WD40 repeat protein